LSVKFENFLVM